MFGEQRQSFVSCILNEIQTKSNELGPVPVGEFVIHSVAPKSRALIFCAPPSLEPKPRTLGALHVSPPNSWFVVE